MYEVFTVPPRTRQVPRVHRSPDRIISTDRQEVKILTQGWGNMKMIFASQNFLACLTASQALTRTQGFHKMSPIFHAGSGQPAIPLRVCEMRSHTILLSQTARCPVTSVQLLSGTCVHMRVERQATARGQQSSLWTFSLALYLLLFSHHVGVSRPGDVTMFDASEKIEIPSKTRNPGVLFTLLLLC